MAKDKVTRKRDQLTEPLMVVDQIMEQALASKGVDTSANQDIAALQCITNNLLANHDIIIRPSEVADDSQPDFDAIQRRDSGCSSAYQLTTSRFLELVLVGRRVDCRDMLTPHEQRYAAAFLDVVLQIVQTSRFEVENTFLRQAPKANQQANRQPSQAGQANATRSTNDLNERKCVELLNPLRIDTDLLEVQAVVTPVAYQQVVRDSQRQSVRYELGALPYN